MKYSDMIVLFFCVGLVMLLFSIIFFVISIRYRKDKKINFNAEEEKMEVQAILLDAKELMRQIDDYAGTVIQKMDERLDEMKKIYKETQKNQEKNMDLKQIQQIKESDEDFNIDNELKDNKKEEIKITNSVHRKIMDMCKEGKKIDEISKELNMGKGEVTLIVKRYKNFSTNF